MHHRQLNLPPVPVEEVSHARENTHPSQGEKPSLTALLAECCEDCGMQEKDAALTQGYDPKYWPRIKSGEKAAHLERIARLPVKVQREFVKRYGHALKLRVTDDDAQRRALADLACAVATAMREVG